MTDIRPFRGIRYDPALVPIDAVVTPPYDVISPEERRRYHLLHPQNVIRLILGEEYPNDSAADNRYTRAAAYWRSWRQQGFLKEESAASYYVYRQRFTLAGREYTRLGFLARLRLVPFASGIVRAHEETHSAPKEELFALLEATAANFSPVWALYNDPEQVARACLLSATERSPVYHFTDSAGVTQELWVLPADEGEPLRRVLAGQPVVIADGHHRYESRLRYQARRAADAPCGDHSAAGWNYSLTYFLAVDDPGLVILPTHRLLRLAEDWEEGRGAPLAACGELLRPFQVVELTPAATADLTGVVASGLAALERVEAERPAFVLVAASGASWLFTLVDEEAMRRVAPERSDTWRRLDVAVLHRLLLDPLREKLPLKELYYTQSPEQVAADLARGTTGGGADWAVLLRPTRAQQVAEVAALGEKMPPKSTFFYPKLLTGLVMDDLEVPVAE
ncbi:MAG: DUF1015 domain-containing protein [Limnochordales bacterium]|nr:DUF1015 domain-containing protein [Limnochordales bacterium]